MKINFHNLFSKNEKQKRRTKKPKNDKLQNIYFICRSLSTLYIVFLILFIEVSRVCVVAVVVVLLLIMIRFERKLVIKVGDLRKQKHSNFENNVTKVSIRETSKKKTSNISFC